MADDYRFPFQLLNDLDFGIQVRGHPGPLVGVGFPLSELEKLCYNPINSESNAYTRDVDPDIFFQNTLELPLPNCKYYFPDDPEYCLSASQAECFYIMHLNICSIPKHFDTLIEECLSL